MSDIADQVDQRIAEALNNAIAIARHAPALPHTGECYFCQEPVDSIRRFCNKECAEDFELEQAQLRRMGRRVEYA
jgi:predicted nucleic acid-binding Zn ribbon protein